MSCDKQTARDQRSGKVRLTSRRVTVSPTVRKLHNAMPMRSILSSGLLLLSCTTVSIGVAHAESMAVRGCYSAPSVTPAPGTQIPANLPAFVFRPAQYAYPIAQRTIDQYALELRSSPGNVLVPFTLEVQADGSYLVKPQQLLAAGSVVLSFLDNCGSYIYYDILDAPVRNERFTYTVVAAVPIPTTLGTVTVKSISYTTQSYSCDRPTWASATLDLVMPPEFTAFPLINLRVWIKDRSYDRQYDRVAAENLIRVSLTAHCFPSSYDPLEGGTNQVKVEAMVVGTANWLQAAPVDVTIDCSPRPADAGAPFCVLDETKPDGGGDLGPDTRSVNLKPDADPVIRDSGSVWVVVEGPADPAAADSGAGVIEGHGPGQEMDASGPGAATMDPSPVRSSSDGCGCTLGGRQDSGIGSKARALGLILAALAAIRRRRSREVPARSR
jgi:hypothetical protein